MNNIKQIFSIKDLENLSGIKAHTIRIWEKRYNLFSPERTDTNIRTYSLESLQKLLNITLLYNKGYKISKIAALPEEEIPVLVKELAAEDHVKNQSINAFKMAMMNFDQRLFFNTYNQLLNNYPFRKIFNDYFIPLLHELGVLWQTNTITPAHEHFISNLIKQKLLINIEKLQTLEPPNTNKVFVLYLPENEIHEIGLLYLQYELSLHGYQCIYLGQTVPLKSLKDLLAYYDNLIFLSYFTIAPSQNKVNDYIEDFGKEVDPDMKSELWLLGKQTQFIDRKTRPNNILVFSDIDQVVKKI